MYEQIFQWGCALAGGTVGAAFCVGFGWVCGVSAARQVCGIVAECLREDEPPAAADSLDEAYRELCREAAPET